MSDLVKWLRMAAFGAKGKAGVKLNEAADTITALQAENERLREALEWFEKHRLDAITRAGAITAREDHEVKVLCEKYGYGAVMDSAARQWACKPDGRSGAFFVGGCIGDTTARAALAGDQ